MKIFTLFQNDDFKLTTVSYIMNAYNCPHTAHILPDWHGTTARTDFPYHTPLAHRQETADTAGH